MNARTTSAKSISGLAAAAVTALCAAVGLFGAAAAKTSAATAAVATPAPATAKVVAFHEAMDALWAAHVALTRNVIIDFDSNLPELKPDFARLLLNQAQIGDAIRPYYGKAAGNELTNLLRRHILDAVPVLSAAKAGNKSKLVSAMKVWYANAHQIAAFLSNANPHDWPLAGTSSMMATHLALTTNEAVAHLEHHWSADIMAYDQVSAEIAMMADTLANGIINQFPQKFA